MHTKIFKLEIVFAFDTLTMPLSTQVYKWVPANLILGVTLQWNSIPSRGTRNIRSRFMLLKPSYAPAWWATWLVCRLNLPTIISIPEMDTKTFIFSRKGWKGLHPYLKAQKSQFLGNSLSRMSIKPLSIANHNYQTCYSYSTGKGHTYGNRNMNQMGNFARIETS